MEELLGYPLDMAQAWLKARGVTAEVVCTAAPRQADIPTVLRVVQVRPGCLVLSPFPSTDPK